MDGGRGGGDKRKGLERFQLRRYCVLKHMGPHKISVMGGKRGKRGLEWSGAYEREERKKDERKWETVEDTGGKLKPREGGEDKRKVDRFLQLSDEE